MYKRPHHYCGRVQANNKSSNTVVVSKMTIATLKAVNYQQFFSDCPTAPQSRPVFFFLALAVSAADTRVSVSGTGRVQSADATLSLPDRTGTVAASVRGKLEAQG